MMMKTFQVLLVLAGVGALVYYLMNRTDVEIKAEKLKRHVA